jgi:collagen beta-1,O-galactosyltransferase
VNFEKVYIINLERRPDRAARMLERVAGALLPAPVELYRAVDAREIDQAYIDSNGYRVYPSWRIPGSPNFWYDRELKLGEIACSLSHYRLWQRCHAEGLNRVLILEDDAGLCADFNARFAEVERELPLDLDLLYLFRVPIGADRPWSPRLVVPGFSHCTVAYALSRSGIEKLLDTGFHRNIIPVDELLPALYSDDIRDDLRSLFGGTRLRAYATLPNLVEQDDKRIMGSDTEASEFFCGAWPLTPPRPP